MYKYPYIPKEYYAATIFACKMLRDNGYFNKAIKIASGYYSVDPDELEKHVRAKTNAGKKAKVEAGYKMKNYEVTITCECDANTEPSFTVKRVKGKNLETVRKRFRKSCLEFSRSNDIGSSYSPYKYIYDIKEID